MKRPTEADYPVFKTHALALSGSDIVEDLEFDDADFFGVVRRASPREFWDYLDASLARSPDAATALALKCSLFPSRTEVNAAIKRKPFLAHRIVEAVEEMAGGAEARALHAFDERTPAELLEDLGIPAALAADLRSQYPHRGQLRIVEHEVATLVLRGPSDGVKKRWQEEWGGREKGRAAFNLAMSCTVVPDEEARRKLFEACPALPYAVLLEPILDLGGASERARRKKH